MRRSLTVAVLLACLATALFFGAQSGSARPVPAAPKGFFGISPQTAMTPEDARYMHAGGIESVREPLVWATIQPTAKKVYDWSSFDASVEVAAAAVTATR